MPALPLSYHHHHLKKNLDSFGRIGFGESFGCLIDPEKEVPFAGAFDRLTANLSLRFNWPFWRFTDWWTGNDKQVAADTKTVYDFAYKVIRRRRALEEKTGVEGGGVVHDLRDDEGDEVNKTGAKKPGVLSGSGKDLMQLFMEATDEKGERLTDDGLKDTLINFLLVSYYPLDPPFFSRVPFIALFTFPFLTCFNVSRRAGYGYFSTENK